MLYKSTALTGYKLNSLDGDIGKVKEFYFDDFYWTVRYLVADTGNWLEGRQVLISPRFLVAINNEEQSITIDLTRKQIEDSPPLESDKPVSRQFEEVHFGYFGLAIYWNDPARLGIDPSQEPNRENSEDAMQEMETWDPNLHSTSSLIGIKIHALDDEIGHVEDFIIEDGNWVIRYLVIDTRNWLPGKRVLVSPQWIKKISWTESTIFVNLLRDDIQHSPEYQEDSPITKEVEAELQQHYDRRKQGVDDPAGGDEAHEKL